MSLRYMLPVILILLITGVCSAEPVSGAARNYMKPELWKGNQSKAKIPVRIERIKSPDGPAILATAVDTWEYQGLELTLPEAIDLNVVGAIQFDFKQNMHPGKSGSCALHIWYEDSKLGVRTHFEYGKEEWNRVVMPIDLRTWLPIGGRGDAVAGKMIKLAWIPWKEMCKPGDSIAISNVKFLAKTSGPEIVRGVTYRYENKPDKGDSSGRVLTDGKVEKADQAHYIQYSDAPDIVFDLHGIYNVNEVVLSAVAMPTQNFSDVQILTSLDGKKFTPAAHFKSRNTNTRESKYRESGKNLSLVGRYIRIVCNRARTDFLINLAEVNFVGALATSEDISEASRKNYSVGPVLPAVNKKDYWLLSDGNSSVWFNKQNGVGVDLTVNQQKIVERLFDRYELSDGKDSILANGYDDKVVSGKVENGVLTLITANPKIPNVRFRQRFHWDGGQLVQHLTYSAKLKEKKILLTSREVVLGQDVRSGGHYETWGSGHYMTHTYADQLSFDLPADSAPVVVFNACPRKKAMLHFRHRWNDRFIRIGAGEITSGLIGEKRTVFTGTGWVLGDGCWVVDSGQSSGSVEARLILAEGDLTAAYDSYLALPDVKSFRSSIKRSPLIKELRAGVAQGWKGMFGNEGLEKARFLNSMIREGIFVFEAGDHNFTWGNFATDGKIRNIFGGCRETNSETRDFFISHRKVAPRAKILQYTWCWSASVLSDVFKKHPDWFVEKNVSGQNLSFFPNFQRNPSRLVGIRESAEDLTRAIVDLNTFFDTDLWYIDGGGSPVNIDWRNLRMDPPDAWDNFYSEVRRQMQKKKPDFMLFSNNPENPLFDMGFLENSGGAMANWKESAIWMYKFKLWQRADPEFVPIFIYWNQNVLEPLTQYAVGTGLLVHPRNLDASYSYYMSAQQQSRYARLVDANVRPNWRVDSEESLELMPLTLGDYGWVLIRNNGNENACRKVSVDSTPLGIKDPERKVYHWELTIKPFKDFKGECGEPEREDIYREFGWQSDFVVSNRFIGYGQLQKQQEKEFEISSGAAKIWLMTQVPAFVYSVDNMRNQLWLPSTLQVSVDGTENPQGANLKVNCQRDNAEIAILIPDGMAVKKIILDGKAVDSKTVFTADTQLAIIAVTRGNSILHIYYAPAEQHKRCELEVITAKPGQTLNLTLSEKPATKLAWQIESDGDVVWCGNSDKSVLSVPLPSALRGGDYVARVVCMDGSVVAEKPFVLESGDSRIPNYKPYATYKPNIEVKHLESVKADLPERNLKIHGGVYKVERANCKAELDPAQASIKLKAHSMYDSFYNKAAAAMEMTTERFVKLKLKSNFAWFAKNGPFPEQRTICIAEEEKNTAVGIVLDFKTPEGYKSRAFVGTGEAHGDREDPSPEDWGCGDVPQVVATMATSITTTGQEDTVWIDLEALGAPADWNQKVLLGLLFQNIGPDRWLEVSVMDTRKELPAGAECAQLYMLKGEAPKLQTIKIPAGKVTVDGRLDRGEWKNSVRFTDFLRMGNVALPCEKTEYRMLADENNLYIAGVFYETKPDGFVTDGTSTWTRDSAEIYLRTMETPTSYYQYIIDASGGYYAKRQERPGKGAQAQDLPKPEFKVVVKQPDTMVFELAIPRSFWTADVRPRFNLGRNRILDGTIQLYSLAPGNQYANFKFFELVF